MGMLDLGFGILTCREVPGPALGYVWLAYIYVGSSILFVSIFILLSWRFKRDTEYYPIANMVTFRPVPVKQNSFVTMQEVVKKLIQAGHSPFAATEMYKSMNRNVFGLVEYSEFRKVNKRCWLRFNTTTMSASAVQTTLHTQALS
jgi:hypothetical protein